MTVYFDNAATTRVCPEAAETAYRLMTELYGNPSSTHTLGRQAKAALDGARAAVADALGADSREVFFTSGGTESDNWAIRMGAALRRRQGRHIVSSPAEHDAVLKSLERLKGEGCEVTLVRLNQRGGVDADAVLEAVRDDTALVSLMLVNNETGAVTDIPAISATLRRLPNPPLLHVDAVQGFLKVPFTAKTLGADMISLSGHKIHAPKGVGALYIRQGTRLQPFTVGGGQESGYRAGTEALPNICAFGEAARVGLEQMPEATERMRALRQSVTARLTAEVADIRILGGGAPHILSVSLPGYRSEVLMSFLESREIYVSKSSACKKGRRSHVLEAMGLKPEVIDGALRISFSRYSSQEEADALCDALRDAKATLFPTLGHR